MSTRRVEEVTVRLLTADLTCDRCGEHGQVRGHPTHATTHLPTISQWCAQHLEPRLVTAATEALTHGTVPGRTGRGTPT